MEKELLFKVIVGEIEGGREYKVYTDGSTEGFKEDGKQLLIFNYFPPLRDLAIGQIATAYRLGQNKEIVNNLEIFSKNFNRWLEKVISPARLLNIETSYQNGSLHINIGTRTIVFDNSGRIVGESN